MQDFLMALINILSIIFPYLIICIALSIILACIFYFWKWKYRNSINTFVNTIMQSEELKKEIKRQQELLEEIKQLERKFGEPDETLQKEIEEMEKTEKIEKIFKNNAWYLGLLYQKSLPNKLSFFLRKDNLELYVGLLSKTVPKEQRNLIYTLYILNFVPTTPHYRFLYQKLEPILDLMPNNNKILFFISSLFLVELKEYHLYFIYNIFNPAHSDYQNLQKQNDYQNLQTQLEKYLDINKIGSYTKEKIQILEILLLRDQKILQSLEVIKDQLRINIPDNLETPFQKAIYLIEEYPKIKPYHLDNSYFSVDYLSGAFYDENQIFCTFVFSEKNVFTWNELAQFSEKEYIILSYLMSKNLLKKEDGKEEIGKIVKKMQLYHIHFIQLFEGKIGDLSQLSNTIKYDPRNGISVLAELSEPSINRMCTRLVELSQGLEYFKEYQKQSGHDWLHLILCSPDILFKKLLFFSKFCEYFSDISEAYAEIPFEKKENYTQEEISCMEKRLFQFKQLCKEAYYSYVFYIGYNTKRTELQKHILLDFKNFMPQIRKKYNLNWKDLLQTSTEVEFTVNLKRVKELLSIDKLLAFQEAIKNGTQKEVVVKLDKVELEQLDQIYPSIDRVPIENPIAYPKENINDASKKMHI